METGASSAPVGHDPAPLNFIYACSICCATFADTYEGHNDTVQGLSDGINPKDRLVTKLYLASCCHVLCNEHLEGGGPPFHPAGQKPKAPCPLCIKDKGDVTPRDLYSIRGFHKGEYDPAIPPSWFSTSATILDGPSKEMEAMRFQYMALIRYCQASYRTRKPLTDELAKSKQELAAMQQRAAEEHAKLISLQHDNDNLRAAAQQVGNTQALRAEVQRLQHLEQEVDRFNADVEAFHRLHADVRDLEVFRKNKAAILDYLKLFPKVVDQNTQMKDRLSKLGFAMAVEPIPNHSQVTSDDLNEIESIAGSYLEDDRRFQKSSSSHTAGRSAYTSGNGADPQHFMSSDRPTKRQRVDSPLPCEMNVDLPSSRDAMPPPSKPLSKMRSMRKLIPSIRKKFSSSRSATKVYQQNNGDTHMYDNPQCRDAAGANDDQSSRHDWRSDTPYMTGALPAKQASQGPQLLASLGEHGNASEFSFRASSPVKMDGGGGSHQPVQLPTGPSYLRLMDGLSHDNSFELGLKDPRKHASNRYSTSNTGRTPISTPQNQRHSPESSSQRRWGLGHAFLHQSPNATPKLVSHHQYAPPLSISQGPFSREHYDPPPGLSNSASNQPQQLIRQVENVVSPFFGRSRYDAPISPRPRIAETQTSSHRFGASQSQRHLTSQVPLDWRETRRLDETSFQDSRLNLRNEPVLHDSYRRPLEHTPSEDYPAQYMNSRILMTRPKMHQASFVNNSSYDSQEHVRPTFSRQRQVQQQLARQPSSSNRALPRIGQLPSVMPSIISSHSPVRNRSQWEVLQRAGVRSSRHEYGGMRGSSVRSVSTNPFARVERRSVKR